jgi:hypothetical protein
LPATGSWLLKSGLGGCCTIPSGPSLVCGGRPWQRSGQPRLVHDHDVDDRIPPIIVVAHQFSLPSDDCVAQYIPRSEH